MMIFFVLEIWNSSFIYFRSVMKSKQSRPQNWNFIVLVIYIVEYIDYKWVAMIWKKKKKILSGQSLPCLSLIGDKFQLILASKSGRRSQSILHSRHFSSWNISLINQFSSIIATKVCTCDALVLVSCWNHGPALSHRWQIELNPAGIINRCQQNEFTLMQMKSNSHRFLFASLKRTRWRWSRVVETWSFLGFLFAIFFFLKKHRAQLKLTRLSRIDIDFFVCVCEQLRLKFALERSRQQGRNKTV